MSELDSRYVYRGFWVNHSKGPIMGRTITTDTKTSTLVIAILAIMSTLGTTYLWNILLFLYHQIRATGKPSDVLFRQEQALIRTLPTPASLATERLKLWFLWRRKVGHTAFRGLFTVLPPALYAIGALFASIFTSAIVSTSNLDVLVRSPFCGFIKQSTPEQGRASLAAYTKSYEGNGVSYAAECYNRDTTESARCENIFLRPSIPFSITEGPCPFAVNMCITDTSPSVVMDSGLLDMNDYFGFNIKPVENVKFRRRTTCAVLSAEDHIRIVDRSELEGSEGYQWPPRYELSHEDYVVILYGGDGRKKNPTWKDVTTQRSLLLANATLEPHAA